MAAELENVSKAQIMGYRRDSFYEIKRAFQMGGTAALVEQRRGPRIPALQLPSRTAFFAVLHVRAQQRGL